MQPEELMNTAGDILDEHNVFAGLLEPDEKQYLMEQGILRSIPAGQLVCRQHDRASSLFIILLGEVEVTEGDKNRRITLARLGKGEVFGEISALFRMPRVSTVTALKPSVLLEIDGDIFEDLMETNSRLLKAVVQRFAERITETALRGVSFLRYLPAHTLHQLQETSALISLLPGSMIVQEGEHGDAMYILVHGAARVTHRLDTQQFNLALLGPGDYFGEWSVLTGAPRAATVTALSCVHAIRIEREALLYFIQNHPDVRDRIDQIAHNRYEMRSQWGGGPETEHQVRNSIQHIQTMLDTY